MTDPTERFLEKISPEPNSGCWLWTASVSGAGYGWIYHSKKSRPAHRVSWEIHKGTIPEGMSVCHHCDTPCCVNPDHLFLGTHADNMSDMDSKGRRRVGVPFSRKERPATIKKVRCRRKLNPTPRGKLSADEVLRIRSSDRKHRDLAAEYGVARSTISMIRSGRNWQHLTQESKS